MGLRRVRFVFTSNIVGDGDRSHTAVRSVVIPSFHLACIFMAYIVMAYMVMTYIFMAYIVWSACLWSTSL